MDIVFRYPTALVQKIYSVFWWTTANQNQTEPSDSGNENDIPVTNPPEKRVSEDHEGSSPVQTTVNSHSGHYDLPHISPQYSKSFSDHNEPAEVDKINVIVKCAGRTMQIDMFPLERISVLLKEACDQAGKKPEKMSLVYEGNCLDVNKTVSKYRLRRGTTVHLIHV